jgi:methylphosphotriester-DNA--protein-cysteine methyltransferase
MAYDLHGLFEAIERDVKAKPRRSLDILAKDMGVSRNTIKKAVVLTTKRSFREFQTKCMLMSTLELLTTLPGKSIKEIAFDLGFRSTRSLERFVKSSTGLSPSDLRKHPPTGERAAQ